MVYIWCYRHIVYLDFPCKNVKDVNVAIATLFLGDLTLENEEDSHE